MNVFYLDHNPRVAAQLQCNAHVVKMILESAQLLCTAHHELGSGTDDMYRSTHVNHPSSVWVRQSRKHYRWLWSHFRWLLNEYAYRYGKTHKSARLLDLLSRPPAIGSNTFTPPPQAMPDEYKHNDTVTAYRQYYISKQHTMGVPMIWTNRTKPMWI